MNQQKIKELLDTLNNLQKNLFSLPDDILINIEARDSDSLKLFFLLIFPLLVLIRLSISKYFYNQLFEKRFRCEWDESLTFKGTSIYC